MARQPKTDLEAQWLARELRRVKQDWILLKDLDPHLTVPALWGHANTPDELLQHVEDVLKDGLSPCKNLHAALHLGELGQALKLAAASRTVELQAQANTQIGGVLGDFFKQGVTVSLPEGPEIPPGYELHRL